MSLTVTPPTWDSIPSDDLDLSTPIGSCCHGSRLLGQESSFVLHGGGNTSVKDPWGDVTGRSVEALLVKGSGWDLATIEPAGFAPLRMERLLELLELDILSDEAMARELAAAKLDPTAPSPSVESLLHAYIPFTAVQHSHADVIVALTNTANGESNVREVFGDDVVVIPYVMPGFDLARVVRELWPEQYHAGTKGMVLLNHGLFTFADTTRAAFDQHMALIMRAQRWLQDRPARQNPRNAPRLVPSPRRVSALRSALSDVAGKPMIVTQHVDAAVAEFVARPDLQEVASRGPITPDHVIRTKRIPMIGTDVGGYAEAYRGYFDAHESRSTQELSVLDPAPRVVLDPELGMLTVGATAKDSAIANDIYRHTMDVIAVAEDRLGGYVALGEGDLFDVEYWELEQAKLRLGGQRPALAGQVAFVTGAASGIGRACAQALLNAGVAVVGVDMDPSVAMTSDAQAYLGVECNVTSRDDITAAISAGVSRFGGIDILVVAAGVFPASELIANLDDDQWRKAMSVNVDSVSVLLREIYPYLCDSPTNGQVVIIGSKNAPAPGPGAAAYSASKAALTQLARVCALEWAEDRIRVNVIHPDAVFDTALWSPELIAERASKYAMTPEQYKTRNLLGTEVRSATVAELTVALCGPAFAATTGAQIPIDGGSDRVI